MKKTLHIDPFSGASGDMFLGALLSLGVPLDLISETVEKVVPGEVTLKAEEVKRGGLACTRCKVSVSDQSARRSMPQMLEVLEKAGLPGEFVDSCVGVLKILGVAEGRAHGEKQAVHLHELGGQDTIADIVGTLVAVEHLEVGRIVCGPVNLGRGFVETEHGTLPIPAPATAYILEGVPVFSEGPEAELTTPTGAALIKHLVSDFRPFSSMDIESVGMGAGGRENPDFPNILRVFLGSEGETGQRKSVMIECGIDDISPEYMAPLYSSLHEKGAQEVHMIPAHTKKGRVGVLLRVLVPADLEDTLIDAILEESGSAGLRFWKVDRAVLPREVVKVETSCGLVSVKRWRMPSGNWRIKVEFDEVMKLSKRAGIRAERLRDEAVAAYYSEYGDGPKKD